MSLITPDFGLLFWMVVIFGIVFFLLAKFGFPVITKAVQKRSDHIADSLKAADEAQAQLANMAQEQAKMIEETRLEQSRILKEASETRASIIAQAREEAQQEAQYVIDPEEFESRGRATPFAGRSVYGRCIRTVHAGRTVYTDK